MKKILIIFLILTLFSGCKSSNTANVKWGMTNDDVKILVNTDNEIFVDNTESYIEIYEKEIFGFTGSLKYYFISGKLVEVDCTFNSDLLDYKADEIYYTLKNKVKSEYGEPVNEFEDDDNLLKTTIWKNNNTQIVICWHSDDKKILLLFSSADFSGEE